VAGGKIKPHNHADAGNAKVDEPVYSLPYIPFVFRVHKPLVYDDDVCQKGSGTVKEEKVECYVFIQYQAYLSVYQFRPAVSPEKVQQGDEKAHDNLNLQRSMGEADFLFTNADMKVSHQGKCRSYGEPGYMQADVDRRQGIFFRSHGGAENPCGHINGYQ
jgi:hypothetical protein